MTIPTKGPKGEALSTDVARLGPDDASRVVVTISSTHGVEGYCGSGFQVDWLASVGAAGLPEGHGGGVRARHQPLRLCLDAAGDGGGQRPQPQLRRPLQALSGERGLSRDRRLPGAEGPRARPTLEAADAKLADYRKKVGDIAYFRAVSGGQYSHPDGMFFGGGGPSWSNRTLHAIADQFLKGRRTCRDRLPYRPRPLRLRRADHPLRHRHAGLAPRARLLG